MTMFTKWSHEQSWSKQAETLTPVHWVGAEYNPSGSLL